jgi:hypothetical protein
VFDLKAGVHFEEEEILARRIVEELDRAGRAIVPRPPSRTAAAISRGALGGGQQRGGGFFHHLLVAALQRTVALAQRHRPGPPVAEDLHLDVARARDIAFEEDAAIAEIAFAQPRDGGEGLAHRRPRLADRMPMPPPPAVALRITG